MRRLPGIAMALLVGCFSTGGDAPLTQDVPVDDASGRGDGATPGSVGGAGGVAPPVGAGSGAPSGVLAGAGAGGVGGDAAGAGGVGGAPALAGTGSVAGSGMAGSGVAGSGVAGGPPVACAVANVLVSVRQPTLVVALSPAASMANAFDGSTRYQAAYDALFGADGVLTRLDGRLRVGGVFLAGGDSCPSGVISEPSPALANVAGAIPGVPTGGFTLGDAALSVAYDLLDDTAIDPTVLWIADGVPLDCSAMTDATVATAGLIDAAAVVGVQTRIVSLSNAAPVVLSVNALAAPTGVAPVVPVTDDELRAGLDLLVSSLASCTFDLNGAVTPGQECTGLVELNGDALACDGPDGWSMIDDHTLRLVGLACENFKTIEASQVRASFPCAAFVPD